MYNAMETLINCVHPSLSDNNIHEKLIIFIIKKSKVVQSIYFSTS